MCAYVNPADVVLAASWREVAADQPLSRPVRQRRRVERRSVREGSTEPEHCLVLLTPAPSQLCPRTGNILK